MSLKKLPTLSLPLLCLLTGALRAADPELQKIETSPPEEISASIRAALSPEVLRVSLDGKPVAEFWLRKEVPLKEPGAGAGLGVSFGHLEEGILVGAVRLPGPWSDYKTNQVPEGTYTMRYGIQPADGNHMGVSAYRDFLLLIPASEDTDLNAAYDHDTLVLHSMKAARKAHPAVLSLFPVRKELAGAELLKNEMGQWTLAAKVGSLVLALVVAGHGEF